MSERLGVHFPDADWLGLLSKLFAIVVVESTGQAGTIVLANDLMIELSGWTSAELEGQPLDVLIPERSRRAHHHYRAGFMMRPETRPMGPDREVLLLHRKGHEIRVWVGLAPVDENNVIAVCLAMDVGRSFGMPAAGTT